MQQRAFTLVELSIVLVILGLLVGGVLTGQSLIRAAELRAVSTEYSRYVAAVQTFRDKYLALPGDMANATAYWGKDNTNCPGNTGTAATPGTCNGDGNGNYVNAPAVSVPGEIFGFWKQLALAGLIEGNYTGLNGPQGSSGADTIPGTNAPRSKLNNGVWAISTFNTTGDGFYYGHDYGNMFYFGSRVSGEFPIGAILKPEEAFNIDTKMDDGKPGAGKIWVRDSNGWGSATSCTTSGGQLDYAGQYALSHTAPACSFIFSQAF